MRKITIVILVLCVVMLTGCSKKTDIGIKKITPDVDFSVEKDVKASDLSAFIFDYVNDLKTIRPFCENIYEIREVEITKNELDDLMNARCDRANWVEHIYDNAYAYLSVLDEDTAYETNRTYTFGSRKVTIEMNETSLSFTMSSVDNFFTQYKLFRIDGELFVSYTRMSSSPTSDLAEYYEYVFYEGHYIYYNLINDSRTYNYVNNFDTDEYYYKLIDYSDDLRKTEDDSENTPYIVFEYGTKDIVNFLVFEDNEIKAAQTFYYKDKVLQFEYTKTFVDEEYTSYKVNPLIIDGWTKLKEHPTTWPYYEFYNGEVKLFDGFVTYMSGIDQSRYPVVTVSDDDDMLNIFGFTQTEIDEVKSSQADFVNNQKKFFRQYNIKSDEPTYEDYIDEFNEIIDLIESYND